MHKQWKTLFTLEILMVTMALEDRGMFQNDYGNWPCGLNIIYGTPPPSIVYSRKIPQELGCCDNSQGRRFLAGEVEWTAADNKPKPFFNSYEEYRREMRMVGQDHSVVPEYRVSEFVEDYFDLDNFGQIETIGDDFLSLTGAIQQHSSGDIQVGSQFFKTYGTSDFMKYFGVMTERLDVEENFDKPYDGSMVPTKLTLRCQAVKRFLPYRGFYPAERLMQLGEIFHENYMKSGSYVATENFNAGQLRGSSISSRLNTDEKYGLLEARIRASKQQAMKLIFGPGILCNSIKAGLAVDYPILPIRDRLPALEPESDDSCAAPPGISPFLASMMIDRAVRIINSGSATRLIDNFTNNEFIQNIARGMPSPLVAQPSMLGGPISTGITAGLSSTALINYGVITAAGMTGSWLNNTLDQGIPRLSGSQYVYNVNDPAYIADEKRGRLARLPNNVVILSGTLGNLSPLQPEYLETHYYGNWKEQGRIPCDPRAFNGNANWFTIVLS